MYVLRTITAIIFCNTLLYASVLDNVIEKENDETLNISQNGYYNIKEHTVKYIPSGDGVQKHTGIDVLKGDIYWIKNGTNKVINMREEGYEKVTGNGTVAWEKGKETLFKVPEEFYNFVVSDHVVSAEGPNITKVFSHDNCSCLNNTICMCCMHVIDVDDQICVGLQIIPDDLGVRVFLIIGNTSFSQEVSVKNPPPICFLNIYKELKLCVVIYDIDTSFKTLHGCLGVTFKTYRLPSPVFVKLGCITAFDGLPASIDRCEAYISSSSVILTCLERPGQKADFFILYLKQNTNIIEKQICNEPDFNITSLDAETVYNVSITPNVIQGNGHSFSFSFNTSTVDGEDFNKTFVNNAVSSLAVQTPITILISVYFIGFYVMPYVFLSHY